MLIMHVYFRNVYMAYIWIVEQMFHKHTPLCAFSWHCLPKFYALYPTVALQLCVICFDTSILGPQLTNYNSKCSSLNIWISFRYHTGSQCTPTIGCSIVQACMFVLEKNVFFYPTTGIIHNQNSISNIFYFKESKWCHQIRQLKKRTSNGS